MLLLSFPPPPNIHADFQGQQRTSQRQRAEALGGQGTSKVPEMLQPTRICLRSMMLTETCLDLTLSVPWTISELQ